MGQKRHRRSRRRPKKTYRQRSRTKKRVSKKRKFPKKRTKTSIIRNKFKMAGGMWRARAGVAAPLPDEWWSMQSVSQNKFSEISEFFKFSSPLATVARWVGKAVTGAAVAIAESAGSEAPEWARRIIRQGTAGWDFNPSSNILRQLGGGCNQSELQFGLPRMGASLPAAVGGPEWQTKDTEWSYCVESDWYHYNNTLKTLLPTESDSATSTISNLHVKIGVVVAPDLPGCSLYVCKRGDGGAGSLEMATTARTPT